MLKHWVCRLPPGVAYVSKPYQVHFRSRALRPLSVGDLLRLMHCHKYPIKNTTALRMLVCPRNCMTWLYCGNTANMVTGNSRLWFRGNKTVFGQVLNTPLGKDSVGIKIDIRENIYWDRPAWFLSPSWLLVDITQTCVLLCWTESMPLAARRPGKGHNLKIKRSSLNWLFCFCSWTKDSLPFTPWSHPLHPIPSHHTSFMRENKEALK